MLPNPPHSAKPDPPNPTHGQEPEPPHPPIWDALSLSHNPEPDSPKPTHAHQPDLPNPNDGPEPVPPLLSIPNPQYPKPALAIPSSGGLQCGLPLRGRENTTQRRRGRGRSMSLSPPTLSPHPGTATTKAAGDIQHSPKQAQMWGTQPTHGEEEEGRVEARTEEEEEEKSSCHPRAAATQPAPCSGGGLGMCSPRQLTEAGSCQGPCMAQAGTHSFTVHRRSCLAAHRGRQTGRQTDRHPLMGTSTHPQECPSIHPPPTPHPPAFSSICPLALLSNHPSAHPPAQRVVHPYAHLLSHPAERLSSCPPTRNIQPAIH